MFKIISQLVILSYSCLSWTFVSKDVFWKSSGRMTAENKHLILSLYPSHLLKMKDDHQEQKGMKEMCILLQHWNKKRLLSGLCRFWIIVTRKWEWAHQWWRWKVTLPGFRAVLSSRNMMWYSNVSHIYNFQISSSHIFLSEKKLVKIILIISFI